MIRLVIADDHPIVRAGLIALFSLEDDLDVIAEAASPDEAVAAVQRESPDVVLMDLQFGARATSTGADATRRIRSLDAAPYVLVLTNYDSDADILGAIEAGASGYRGPRTRQHRTLQQRHRREPLHQRTHRQVAPLPHFLQTRRHLPHRRRSCSPYQGDPALDRMSCLVIDRP